MGLLNNLLRGTQQGGRNKPLPLLGPHDFYVELAGFKVPASLLITGVITLGVPRTGKTSFIEGVEREFVRQGCGLISVDFEGNKDHRLRCMVPQDSGYKVHRIDVTTKGGTAIDFRPLWRTQSDRDRFAQKMSPVHEGHQNAYFDAAAQELILAAVSQCMEWGPKTCTLADAVRLADSPYLLSELGRQVPSIGDPFEVIGMTARGAREVRATTRTKLRPLMIYASLSLHAKETVDLIGIANGSSPAAACLVYKDTHKQAMERIYSFALDCAVYERLTNGHEKYFLCNYDEATSLARLESLVDLIRRGAKRGLVYMLSAHSIEGLFKRYGNEDGEDVASLPSHKIILKLQSKKSASWASDALGVCEVLNNIAPRPYMRAPNNDDRYEGNIADRANVHWDEIRRLPVASWSEDRIRGFVDFPDFTKPFEAPFRHLVQTAQGPPKHEPADPSWEILPPLNQSDMKRIGIPLEIYHAAEKRRKKAVEGKDKQEDE